MERQTKITEFIFKERQTNLNEFVKREDKNEN